MFHQDYTYSFRKIWKTFYINLETNLLTGMAITIILIAITKLHQISLVFIIGQLISKELFGILNSPKKTNKKKSTLLLRYLRSNCFRSFLGPVQWLFKAPLCITLKIKIWGVAFKLFQEGNFFMSRFLTKGQLISKCLFGVFKFFQKTKQKQIDLRYLSR